MNHGAAVSYLSRLRDAILVDKAGSKTRGAVTLRGGWDEPGARGFDEEARQTGRNFSHDVPQVGA